MFFGNTHSVIYKWLQKVAALVMNFLFIRNVEQMSRVIVIQYQSSCPLMRFVNLFIRSLDEKIQVSG